MDTLPPELEAELRSQINPVYADTPGTESYERKRLLDKIDPLRQQVGNSEDMRKAAVLDLEAPVTELAALKRGKGQPIVWFTYQTGALEARVAELLEHVDALKKHIQVHEFDLAGIEAGGLVLYCAGANVMANRIADKSDSDETARNHDDRLRHLDDDAGRSGAGSERRMRT